MKEELIKYLTKLVYTQEKIYWFKWDRSDLTVFRDLLVLDLSFMKEETPFWESLIDIIKNENR
jgi:hypothetical protein